MEKELIKLIYRTVNVDEMLNRTNKLSLTRMFYHLIKLDTRYCSLFFFLLHKLFCLWSKLKIISKHFYPKYFDFITNYLNVYTFSGMPVGMFRVNPIYEFFDKTSVCFLKDYYYKYICTESTLFEVRALDFLQILSWN